MKLHRFTTFYYALALFRFRCCCCSILLATTRIMVGRRCARQYNILCRTYSMDPKSSIMYISTENKCESNGKKICTEEENYNEVSSLRFRCCCSVFDDAVAVRIPGATLVRRRIYSMCAWGNVQMHRAHTNNNTKRKIISKRWPNRIWSVCVCQWQ